MNTKYLQKFILAVLFFGVSGSSFGNVWICNESSSSHISVAFGLWYPAKRIHKHADLTREVRLNLEGWYTVNRGDCVSVAEFDARYAGYDSLVRPLPSHQQYVYVVGHGYETKTGKRFVWKGDFRTCGDARVGFRYSLTSPSRNCGGNPTIDYLRIPLSYVKQYQQILLKFKDEAGFLEDYPAKGNGYNVYGSEVNEFDLGF